MDKANASALVDAVERGMSSFRSMHGWVPGATWNPAAWTSGQDCGCPRPCGYYEPPGRGGWVPPTPPPGLPSERHTLAIAEVEAIVAARAACTPAEPCRQSGCPACDPCEVRP